MTNHQTTIPVLPVTVLIGKTNDVTDGFWDFLKPLHIGKHEIDISTNLIDPREVNNSNTQIKYHFNYEAVA